jgi:dienelactone hydrolase
MTPTQTGLAIVELAQSGRFDDIVEMFAANLRPMVSAEAIRSAWAGAVGQHGPLIGVGTTVGEPVATGMHAVRVPLVFERGELTLVVTAIDGGQLGGIQLAAAAPVEPWSVPSYVDPAAFVEREVTVGDGPFAVPGSLCLPTSARAGVVLLSGSGPNGRDGTIGRVKPLKDLAWGLASRGIATLRFDKVTFAHPGDLDVDRFTLDDEYLPHAVAAVDLLAGHAGQVFVLGHSLGGTVAPRVAEAAPSVAGLVVLGGGAAPLQWTLLRQFRHLTEGKPGAAEILADVERRVRAVDSATATTSRADLPFDIPASYWIDLRDYDAPAAAAAVTKPILVLQGGRDYQVTVDDDLPLWRAALAGRDDVDVRVYPDDDHAFVTRDAPSTPADYEQPGHVDPAVVADIANWLLAHVKA